MILRCFPIALVSLTVVLQGPAGYAGTAYDVYLLAGQSNMDGRGKAAELGGEQRKPMEAVSIFYRNPSASTDGWKPLAPGYSIAPGYKGTLPSPTFGPEIGFARAMVQARPDHRLALIKGSKGGTSLAKHWNPGIKGKPDTQGICYRNFLVTIDLAKKDLKKDDSVVLCGLLWHQGESDADSTVEVYQQRLTTFISRIREDLSQADLPVVVGEVFDNGKRDSVRKALRAVASAVPHVGFAAADGLKTSDKGSHFDTASQIILGERFAKEMLRFRSRPTR